MTYSETFVARFWAKVEKTDGCWRWRGAISDTGYGNAHLRPGKALLAHRVAYELEVGPIPDGRELDHICRNRGCVNPDHLEPVSHRMNALRGESPAATNHRRTRCVNGHELAGANVSTRGKGWRRCLVCHRERERRYRLANGDHVRALERARYHARKRAALPGGGAALEEQFLVRWQLDDIRRQMEEARAEGDWPLAKVIGRAETAEAALEAANARARMLERRADATQADNDALVALADAARELIDGHGDEQLALNVLADALDAYDRDGLAGTRSKGK